MDNWKDQEILKFYIESFSALNVQTQKFLSGMLIFFADDNRKLQKDDQIYPLAFREKTKN